MADNMLKELSILKERYGFELPDRGNVDDPNIIWRHGKPDFTAADLSYLKGKSKNHPESSLEKLVENLVKKWEMEASHKAEFLQWDTVDHEKYRVSANGWAPYIGLDAHVAGNYNVLLTGINKDLYDSSKETFASSHDLFRGTFKDGFPWEVLHVFSGPPKVVFSWRHWGIFNGNYKGRTGDGEMYEMFGICEVMVNEMLKVESIEVYYKPEEFLKALEGSVSHEDLRGAKTVMGDGCPIAQGFAVSK